MRLEVVGRETVRHDLDDGWVEVRSGISPYRVQESKDARYRRVQQAIGQMGGMGHGVVTSLAQLAERLREEPDLHDGDDVEPDLSEDAKEPEGVKTSETSDPDPEISEEMVRDARIAAMRAGLDIHVLLAHFVVRWSLDIEPSLENIRDLPEEVVNWLSGLAYDALPASERSLVEAEPDFGIAT